MSTQQKLKGDDLIVANLKDRIHTYPGEKIEVKSTDFVSLGNELTHIHISIRTTTHKLISVTEYDLDEWKRIVGDDFRFVGINIFSNYKHEKNLLKVEISFQRRGWNLQ